jgi:XTP/dITP diphosphohydrolase
LSSNPSQAILQSLDHLIQVVAKLRSPDGGCPWDLAQTQESLIPYVIEEAYEVVHAIKTGDQKAIAEELGDLLLQVILQAHGKGLHLHKQTQEFKRWLIAILRNWQKRRTMK